ncbi:MAG: hypothetical protein IPJ17_10625 [Holophagales bacterium]|nr:MAG: hypothetical protein IPJ17_10625 [Holophagales bacterium]
MVRKRKLATLLAYLTLEFGALTGVPVRLDQIEEMTRLLSRPSQVLVLQRDAGGEPPPEGAAEAERRSWLPPS